MSQPKISIGYLPHLSEVHPRPPLEDLFGQRHPLYTNSSTHYRAAYLVEGETGKLAAAAYSYTWDREAFLPLLPWPARLVSALSLAVRPRYESTLKSGIGLFEFEAAINAPRALRVQLGASALNSLAFHSGTSRLHALVRVGDDLAREAYEEAGFLAGEFRGKYNGQVYQYMTFDPLRR